MLHDHDVTAFIENAENNGTVDIVSIEELAEALDLGDDELAVVRAELEARGVDITPAPATAEDDELELDLEPEAAASVDSLRQFMNEIGRHALLTAAEEVALAKRVERGDKDAKERMINSNLRLVVSIATRYQGTACRWETSFRRAHSASTVPSRSSTGVEASSSRRTRHGGSGKRASAPSPISQRRSESLHTSTSVG